MERKPVPKNAREGKPDFPYENVSFVGVTLTTRERVFHRRNDLGALAAGVQLPSRRALMRR
jgi:hypothetical protein